MVEFLLNFEYGTHLNAMLKLLTLLMTNYAFGLSYNSNELYYTIIYVTCFGSIDFWGAIIQ